MKQQEFTNYIIQELIKSFPQFEGHLTTKPGDIIDIDFKSNNENLTLWVTTQDKEITIGFTGYTECDWHTHMSLFGANTPHEELFAAIELIDNILRDKQPIIFSNIKGYFLTDNIDINVVSNEAIQILKWSDL
ncbi:MAG: hypothetical protein H7257_03865 [Taibaiella sp.]|nr:hypothetical protein [Taibaiella sp.]